SLALIAAAGASLAACGSDKGTSGSAAGPAGAGSDSTPIKSSASVSKTDYIRRADAMCRQLVSSLHKKLDNAGPTNSRSEAVKQMRVVSTATVATTERLAGLPVPQGDEAKIAAIIGTQRSANGTILKMIKAVQDNDKAGYERLRTVLQTTGTKERS